MSRFDTEKRKLILNIPHASREIPSRRDFQLTDELLQEEIFKLTDWLTDDLFDHANAVKVIAPVSRIYCDTERFTDDKQEIMARYGMGVLYTHSDAGKLIRTISPRDRNDILNQYYYPHHKMLDSLVAEQLQQYGQATIVDCHSFPNEPLNRDLNKEQPRPDFNLGTDAFHTPKKFVEEAVHYFNDHGYSVGVDWPYAGTLVPSNYFQKSKHVRSIMVEINRKLYMDSATFLKSQGYDHCKKVVSGFLDLIWNLS